MPNGARGGLVKTQWPDNRCWGKNIASDGWEAEEAAANRPETFVLLLGWKQVLYIDFVALGCLVIRLNPERGREEQNAQHAAAPDRGVAVPRVGGMAVGQQENKPRLWSLAWSLDGLCLWFCRCSERQAEQPVPDAEANLSNEWMGVRRQMTTTQ